MRNSSQVSEWGEVSTRSVMTFFTTITDSKQFSEILFWQNVKKTNTDVNLVVQMRWNISFKDCIYVQETWILSSIYFSM